MERLLLGTALLLAGSGCQSLWEISSPEFSAKSLPFDFAATAPLDDEAAGGLAPLTLEPAVGRAAEVFRKNRSAQNSLALAEVCYAVAERDELAGNSRCCDYYFFACAFASPALFRDNQSPHQSLQLSHASSESPNWGFESGLVNEQIGRLYNAALGRCLAAAQRYGRLDPRRHLLVNTPGRVLEVQITHHGFPWRTEDFDWIALVEEYESDELTRQHRRGGLGANLVVFRQKQQNESRAVDEPFFRDMQPFAATVLLKPNTDELLNALLGEQGDRGRRRPKGPERWRPKGPDEEAKADRSPTARRIHDGGTILEFHDPLRVHFVKFQNRYVDLAADLTAPLAAVVENPDRRKLELLGFLRPGNSLRSSRLYMVEPYQPGKIPVVLVHGLLSSPLTWGDMVNDLRADAFVHQRYQIWLYRYPTGDPFLKSAAELRAALRAALETVDPHGTDEALSQMVLIGHSMGGLLSKLQIASSGKTLWDLFASKPLVQLEMDDSTRAALDTIFFFDPQPFVRRVIFIGAPHRGSRFATNFLGKIGTRLIEPPKEQMAALEKAAKANPGAFRSQSGLAPWAASGQAIPSSVDLLAPQSSLLMAMLQLPMSSRAATHSIIGQINGLPLLSAGDGVVPVSSAKVEGVESEAIVNAHHALVHRHQESIAEVKRILQLHVYRGRWRPKGPGEATALRGERPR